MNALIVDLFFENNFKLIKSTLFHHGLIPTNPKMAQHALIKEIEVEGKYTVDQDFKTIVPFLAARRMIEIHEKFSTGGIGGHRTKAELEISGELFKLLTTIDECIEFIGTVSGLRYTGEHLIQTFMEEE